MYYTVKSYDFKRFFETPVIRSTKGNKTGKKKGKIYKNLICAFDIETTRLKEIEQSIMYIWQFGIMYENGEIDVIIGRTWEEFEELLSTIKGEYNLGIVPIFVHNLSYEFQFLRSIYHFSKDEVFCVKNRRILKCDMYEKFEFRCSYLQTNMSLDTFTKNMNVEHQKLSGDDFDYSKIRYPWTELTDYELNYSGYDVIGLLEAIKKRMELFNDNIYTFPLTSTGYVRRDTKKVMLKYARKYLRDLFVDYDCFTLLSEAFRGGDTHANRYYAGITVENVASFDRSSSYPDVIENCYFPMKRFQFIGDITEQELKHKMDKGYACLFRVQITGLEQKDKFYGSPYISFSKCRGVENSVKDNGRLLSASYLATTITDIDYGIIREEYTWKEIKILDCYISRYGELPQELKQVVRDYYTKKTELKGVDGEELMYNLSKALLNAVYGMMVQSPVKQSIDFNENDIDNLYKEQEEDETELLEHYNNKAFLPYQWGVWVTAWARYRLKEMINIVGDRFVYSDTDSVKFVLSKEEVKNKEILEAIARYNALRETDSKKNKAYATDKNGITHYMGVYENEGIYEQFITLGAKRYAFIKNGEMDLTVSGVSKKINPETEKKIAVEELEAKGGLKAFNFGFTFYKSGGSEIIFNDIPYGEYEIDKDHSLYIGQNAVIKDSEYTIKENDYLQFLTDIRNITELNKYIDNYSRTW
jgi:hypothetical protein